MEAGTEGATPNEDRRLWKRRLSAPGAVQRGDRVDVHTLLDRKLGMAV